MDVKSVAPGAGNGPIARRRGRRVDTAIIIVLLLLLLRQDGRPTLFAKVERVKGVDALVSVVAAKDEHHVAVQERRAMQRASGRNVWIIGMLILLFGLYIWFEFGVFADERVFEMFLEAVLVGNGPEIRE